MKLVKTPIGYGYVSADHGSRFVEVTYFDGAYILHQRSQVINMIPDDGAQRKLSDLEVILKHKLNELTTNSDAQIIQRNVLNEILNLIK
jgi:hypothetical protein